MSPICVWYLGVRALPAWCVCILLISLLIILRQVRSVRHFRLNDPSPYVPGMQVRSLVSVHRWHHCATCCATTLQVVLIEVFRRWVSPSRLPAPRLSLRQIIRAILAMLLPLHPILLLHLRTTRQTFIRPTRSRIPMPTGMTLLPPWSLPL